MAVGLVPLYRFGAVGRPVARVRATAGALRPFAPDTRMAWSQRVRAWIAGCKCSCIKHFRRRRGGGPPNAAMVGQGLVTDLLRVHARRPARLLGLIFCVFAAYTRGIRDPCCARSPTRVWLRVRIPVCSASCRVSVRAAVSYCIGTWFFTIWARAQNRCGGYNF